MPVLIALLGLAAAVSVWIWRMRAAAETAQELRDIAGTALGAVRRWRFRRSHAGHPVEGIDDPLMAQGTLACAFAELGPVPTREDRAALLAALQRHLRIDLGAAEELTVIARFLVNECGSPQAAVERIARRLRRLSGENGLDPALAVVSDALDGLTDRQREALDDLRRIFGR